MRILVINTAASVGGAVSILRDFVENIKGNDKENEWIFILSEPHITESHNIKVIINKELKNNFKRLNFELLSGAKFINNEIKPDVVFSMQNTTIKGLNIPQILYLHQSLPFQNIKKFSFFKKSERNLAIKQYVVGFFIKLGLKRPKSIIVQTNWMKNSIKKYISSNNDVLVIEPEIKNIKGKNYLEYYTNRFFYPTSDEVYKDISVIERATSILTKKGYDFEIDITIENKNNETINYIGRVTREEVYGQLSSKILIFPSYIETYGLPLVEARELDAIILASDTEVSREVLFGYNNVYFFSVGSEIELAVLMEKCIKGQIKRKINSLNNQVQKDTWSDVRKAIYDLGVES